MFQKLDIESSKSGLSINEGKTKYMEITQRYNKSNEFIGLQLKKWNI